MLESKQDESVFDQSTGANLTASEVERNMQEGFERAAADFKFPGIDIQQEQADRMLATLLPLEEIRRMVAGGTTSKDVIARMYGLTPE